MIFLKEAWKPDIKRDLVHVKFEPLQPALLSSSEMSSWPRPVILSKKFFTIHRAERTEKLFSLSLLSCAQTSHLRDPETELVTQTWTPCYETIMFVMYVKLTEVFVKLKSQSVVKEERRHVLYDHEGLAQNKLNFQLLAIDCCSFRKLQEILGFPNHHGINLIYYVSL